MKRAETSAKTDSPPEDGEVSILSGMETVLTNLGIGLVSSHTEDDVYHTGLADSPKPRVDEDTEDGRVNKSWGDYRRKEGTATFSSDTEGFSEKPMLVGTKPLPSIFVGSQHGSKPGVQYMSKVAQEARSHEDMVSAKLKAAPEVQGAKLPLSFRDGFQHAAKPGVKYEARGNVKMKMTSAEQKAASAGGQTKLSAPLVETTPVNQNNLRIEALDEEDKARRREISDLPSHLSMPPTRRQSTAPAETGTSEERDDVIINHMVPKGFDEPEDTEVEVPPLYVLPTATPVVDDIAQADFVTPWEDRKLKWYQKRRSLLGILVLVIIVAVLITLGATGVFTGPRDKFIPPEPNNTMNNTMVCPEFDLSSLRLPLRFCNNSTCWEQIGSDLRGTKPKGNFARYPALAKGGSRFVLSVGNEGDLEDDGDNGTVLVYDIDDVGSFNQVGRAFRGEHPGDELRGYLSRDGNRIVVTAPYWSGVDGRKDRSGRVRVFELQSGNWVQLGEHMDGENKRDRFGYSAALNRVGNILAVGATFFETDGKRKGSVRVFGFQTNGTSNGFQTNGTSNGNSTGTENDAYWKPLGHPIIPNDVDFNEKSGWTVALSDDGMIVAIGAKDGDKRESAGRIRVFRYINSTWTQMGNDLDGERSDDDYGRYIAMSADGTTVAGAAYLHDGDGGTKIDSGQVRVYHYNQSSWLPLGRDLYGENAGDMLMKVSLSANGDRLAMFTGTQTFNSTFPGYVRVYDLVDGDWQQVGGRLTGPAYDGDFGADAALSAGGDRLIVQSRSHDGDPCFGGLIRVFQKTVA